MFLKSFFETSKKLKTIFLELRPSHKKENPAGRFFGSYLFYPLICFCPIIHVKYIHFQVCDLISATVLATFGKINHTFSC